MGEEPYNTMKMNSHMDTFITGKTIFIKLSNKYPRFI